MPVESDAVQRWASFDDFVLARGHSLWRAAWLLTGDCQRAEDLVQTALAKSYRRFADLNDSGAHEPYLRRTMYTTFCSWWSQRWTGEIPSDAVGDSPADTGDAISLDVTRALADLPRAQRAVIVLRYRRTAVVRWVDVPGPASCSTPS